MTPKQKVLKQYPKAVAKQWAEGWCIERSMRFQATPISAFKGSPTAAWAAAAKRIVR